MKKGKKRIMALVLSVILAAIVMVPAGVGMKETKAETVTATHTFDPSTLSAGDVTVDTKYVTDEYFTMHCGGSKLTIQASKKTIDGTAYQVRCKTNGTSSVKDGNPVRAIGFTTTGKAKVTVWAVSGASSTRKWAVSQIVDGEYADNESNTFEVDNSGDAAVCIRSIVLDTAGTYYVHSTLDSVAFYKIVVEEYASSTPAPDPEPVNYDIIVKDEKALGASVKNNSYADGTNLTLSATDTEKFLYWMNSNGRIVSRESRVTFPVYYADTYTAVYKSEVETVKYMTSFGQVYKKFAATELTVEPNGPTRYGYEFDKWSMSLDDIEQAVLGGAKDVEVTPVYKEITTTVTVTVNGDVKTPKLNEVVMADASGDADFSYWKDQNGNKLSYNPVYYFFASSEVTEVTAVTGVSEEATGVIQNVANKTNGSDKSYVFLFTVPDGCTIEFAGIASSSTEANPTLTSANIVRGNSFKTTTVRYTWTKTNATEVWHVKPILKYKNSEGAVITMEGTVVNY